MSACARKRPYRSKKQAAGAACRIMSGPGKPPKIYTYQCSECGKWHLTKQPPQDVIPARPQPVSVPSSAVLSPRQVELRRIISEAKEMQGRWGGIVALLDRIDRNDNLDGIGGEVEAMATAHNAVVQRKQETGKLVERLFILIHYSAASPRLRSSVAGPSKP